MNKFLLNLNIKVIKLEVIININLLIMTGTKMLDAINFKISNNYFFDHYNQTKNKIDLLAQRFFCCLKLIFTYPKRYFGSKFWSLKSGYRFNNEKTLSSTELRAYLKYIYANAFCQNGKHNGYKSEHLKIINPKSFELEDSCDLEARKNCFFDPESGLKIVLFEVGNEVIISIGALGSFGSEVSDTISREDLRRKTLSSAYSNLFGGVPERFLQAENFVLNISENSKLSGKKITLSGNCIGASIISYIALQNEIYAVCFNPLAIGPGIQQRIGNKNLSKANEFVTNISIKTDWASDPIILNLIDKIVSILGIRTPGNFGHRYRIPTIFGWHLVETHRKPLASINQYLNSG